MEPQEMVNDSRIESQSKQAATEEQGLTPESNKFGKADVEKIDDALEAFDQIRDLVQDIGASVIERRIEVAKSNKREREAVIQVQYPNKKRNESSSSSSCRTILPDTGENQNNVPQIKNMICIFIELQRVQKYFAEEMSATMHEAKLYVMLKQQNLGEDSG